MLISRSTADRQASAVCWKQNWNAFSSSSPVCDRIRGWNVSRSTTNKSCTYLQKSFQLWVPSKCSRHLPGARSAPRRLRQPRHHRPKISLPARNYIRVQGQQPSASGRYRLDEVLGKGAFGLVYLGYDEELQRKVAVKVPTGTQLSRREHAEQYLAEARTVARLNHPHIVSVYDVGRAEDRSIYVVSRYIPGGTLQKRLQVQRPDVRDGVRSRYAPVATLAVRGRTVTGGLTSTARLVTWGTV